MCFKDEETCPTCGALLQYTIVSPDDYPLDIFIESCETCCYKIGYPDDESYDDLQIDFI